MSALFDFRYLRSDRHGGVVKNAAIVFFNKNSVPYQVGVARISLHTKFQYISTEFLAGMTPTDLRAPTLQILRYL